MTRLLKTLTAGTTAVIGIAVASAVHAQQGQPPSPHMPSMMPGMQQSEMMPQMSQMTGGCMQMMKSHMPQPTGPSTKPDVEQKG
jgi:hypothetical protein